MTSETGGINENSPAVEAADNGEPPDLPLNEGGPGQGASAAPFYDFGAAKSPPDDPSAAIDQPSVAEPAERQVVGPTPTPGAVENTASDAGEPKAELSPNSGRLTQQKVKVNKGVVAAVVNIVAEQLEQHRLTQAYVDEHVARYVSPGDFEDAERKLRDYRVLALVADEDHGRHDAALAVLTAMGGMKLREVYREPGDTISIGAIPQKQDSGWILDLRSDVRVPESYGRSLTSDLTRQKMLDFRSYLVVIFPPQLWEQCSAGGGVISYRIPRPDAVEIVRERLHRWMRKEDIDLWLSDDRVLSRLAHETPSRAIDWETHIKSVEGLSEDSLSLPTVEDKRFENPLHEARVRMVVAASGNWQSQLTDWYEEHTDCQVRDFLLAAAVLEGKSAGEIFKAVGSLASSLNGPQHEAAGQQGAGILQLTRSISARVTEESRIEFIKPGYADAVLDYFWLDRQHLQSDLLAWMCQRALAEADEVTALTIADRISTYILKWTRRSGNLRFVAQVCESWAKHDKLRTVAAEMLTAASLDSTIGRIVRDRILEWTKPDRTLASDFLMLVTGVCGGAFAEIHPRLAILRLSNLTQNSDPLVAEAAQSQIARLWRNPLLKSDIVSQARNRLGPQDQLHASGRAMFIALAEVVSDNGEMPGLLEYALTDASARELVVNGWRSVLLSKQPRQSRSERAMYRWLDAARLAPLVSDLLYSTLTSAAEAPAGSPDDARARIALLSVLHRWRDGVEEDDPAFPEAFFKTLERRIIDDDERESARIPSPTVGDDPDGDVGGLLGAERALGELHQR